MRPTIRSGSFAGDHSLTSKQRLTARYFYLHFDSPWVTIPGQSALRECGTVRIRASRHRRSHVLNHAPVAERVQRDLSLEHPESQSAVGSPSFDKLGARIKSIPGFETMDVGISNWSGIDSRSGVLQSADNLRLGR